MHSSHFASLIETSRSSRARQRDISKLQTDEPSNTTKTKQKRNIISQQQPGATNDAVEGPRMRRSVGRQSVEVKEDLSCEPIDGISTRENTPMSIWHVKETESTLSEQMNEKAKGSVGRKSKRMSTNKYKEGVQADEEHQWRQQPADKGKLINEKSLVKKVFWAVFYIAFLTLLVVLGLWCRSLLHAFRPVETETPPLKIDGKEMSMGAVVVRSLSGLSEQPVPNSEDFKTPLPVFSPLTVTSLVQSEEQALPKVGLLTSEEALTIKGTTSGMSGGFQFLQDIPGAPLLKQPVILALYTPHPFLITPVSQKKDLPIASSAVTSLIINLTRSTGTNLYRYLAGLLTDPSASSPSDMSEKASLARIQNSCRWLSSSSSPDLKVTEHSPNSDLTYAFRNVSKGEPLMHIPRHMILSSYDANPVFLNRCFVKPVSIPSASSTPVPRRKCRNTEILILQVLYEMMLQKVSVASASTCSSPEEETTRASQNFRLIPPESSQELHLTAERTREDAVETSRQVPCGLVSCYIYSNKHNAPYFIDSLWKAIQLVLPYSKNRYNQLIDSMQKLVEEEFGDVFTFKIPSSCRNDFSPETGNNKESSPVLSQVFPAAGDYQEAVSIVMSRSLWDVNGHSAVTPLDDLLQMHWNEDNVLSHQANPEGLTWVAPRALKQGELVYSGQGQYNNLRLLYQHGVIIADNHWGPVWFLRRGVDEPIIRFSEPTTSSLAGFIGTMPYVASEAAALALLPSWATDTLSLQNVKVHFLNRQTKNKHSSDGEIADCGVGDERGCTPDADENGISVNCDLWTFYSHKTYKHGSIVARLQIAGGKVGGFTESVYVCLREMKYRKIENPIEREIASASLFRNMCKEHNYALGLARDLLEGGASQKADDMTDTSPPIEAMLQTALDSEAAMMRYCLDYFEALLISLSPSLDRV